VGGDSGLGFGSRLINAKVLASLKPKLRRGGRRICGFLRARRFVSITRISEMRLKRSSKQKVYKKILVSWISQNISIQKFKQRFVLFLYIRYIEEKSSFD